MADFCKECSEGLFGVDFHDLANLTTLEDTEAGLFCLVLCESCGLIQVDHNGLNIHEKCSLAASPIQE